MTIQNIDDVMDRIMSLNRNLSEDSLKTLLSASGWDREDISEGVRIFRSRDKNNVLATPTESYIRKDNKDENKESNMIDINNDSPQNDDFYKSNIYNFNLNRNSKEEKEHIDKNLLEKEEEESKKSILDLNEKNDDSYKPIVLNYSGNMSTDKNSEESIINKINTNNNNLENNSYLKINKNSANQSSEIKNEKKHHSISKLFFYIILILILLITGAYLLSQNFKKSVNQKLDLAYLNTMNKIATIFNKKEFPYTNNEVNVSNVENEAPGNSSSPNMMAPTSSSTNVGNGSLNDLENQILELKNELENYKNSGSQSQTIVKYISQVGPTGKAGSNGRGISFISATDTGFIINYTDGTNILVPYSTTTVVNIINSNSVCFRDASSIVPSSTDICLDKNIVSEILYGN